MGKKAGLNNKVKTGGYKAGMNNRMKSGGQKGGMNNRMKSGGQKAGMNNRMKTGGQKGGMNNRMKTGGQKGGMNNRMKTGGQKAGMNNRMKTGGQKRGMDNRMKTGGQKRGMDNKMKDTEKKAGMEGKKASRPRVLAGKRRPFKKTSAAERKERAIIRSKQIQKQRARKLVDDLDAERAIQKRMERGYKKASQSYHRYKEQKRENREKVFRIKDIVDKKMVYQAVSAIRKLENKVDKSRDVTGSDTEPVLMQVTLVKLQTSLRSKDINAKTRIKVKLPNNPITDSTEVLLITHDKFTGRDFTRTTDYYKYRLMRNKANELVSEVMPVKQLKIEYTDFEAKRKLATRFDVVLCDREAMPGIEQLLGKHFFKRNKYPVECNLMKRSLRKELDRAQSTTHLTFGSGNCATMRVGHLNQTDDQLAHNIMSAVRNITLRCPGGWANIQNISLKRLFSMSVPFYINLSPMNAIGRIEPTPQKEAKKGAVIGTLTTQPSNSVIVYPDGNVFLGALRKDPEERQKKKEKVEEKQKKMEEKLNKKQKRKQEERENKESNTKRTKMMGQENAEGELNEVHTRLKDKEAAEKMLYTLLPAGTVGNNNISADDDDDWKEGDVETDLNWKKVLSQPVPGKERRKMAKMVKKERKLDTEQAEAVKLSNEERKMIEMRGKFEEEKMRNKVVKEFKNAAADIDVSGGDGGVGFGVDDDDDGEHWLVKAVQKRKPKGKKAKKKKAVNSDDDDGEAVDFGSVGEEAVDLHEKAYLERLSKKRKAESSRGDEVDAWAEDSESDTDMDD